MDNYLRPSRMWSVFVTIPLIGFIVGIASFYYTLKDLLLIGIPYDPITLEANYILLHTLVIWWLGFSCSSLS